MHPTDIVGWTNGTGCIFCPRCEPEDNPAEKAPVFADSDDWRRYTCDACEEPLDPNYSPKHWGYGSGMPGCLFDYGPHFCETQDDAIDGVLWLFSETGNESDLTEAELEQARADLKECGTHYFPAERRLELGASMVQVWESDGPCPEDDDS